MKPIKNETKEHGADRAASAYTLLLNWTDQLHGERPTRIQGLMASSIWVLTPMGSSLPHIDYVDGVISLLEVHKADMERMVGDASMSRMAGLVSVLMW